MARHSSKSQSGGHLFDVNCFSQSIIPELKQSPTLLLQAFKGAEQAVLQDCKDTGALASAASATARPKQPHTHLHRCSCAACIVDIHTDQEHSSSTSSAMSVVL
jgi:hypothetical protein